MKVKTGFEMSVMIATGVVLGYLVGYLVPAWQGLFVATGTLYGLCAYGVYKATVALGTMEDRVGSPLLHKLELNDVYISFILVFVILVVVTIAVCAYVVLFFWRPRVRTHV